MSKVCIVYSTTDGRRGLAIFDRITHIEGTERDADCIIYLDNRNQIETSENLVDLRNRVEVAFSLRQMKQGD